MEKADYFKVYGYLLTLRDIFEQKARACKKEGLTRPTASKTESATAQHHRQGGVQWNYTMLRPKITRGVFTHGLQRYSKRDRRHYITG